VVTHRLNTASKTQNMFFQMFKIMFIVSFHKDLGFMCTWCSIYLKNKLVGLFPWRYTILSLLTNNCASEFWKLGKCFPHSSTGQSNCIQHIHNERCLVNKNGKLSLCPSMMLFKVHRGTEHLMEINCEWFNSTSYCYL